MAKTASGISPTGDRLPHKEPTHKPMFTKIRHVLEKMIASRSSLLLTRWDIHSPAYASIEKTKVVTAGS
jgi:hypothetical protein